MTDPKNDDIPEGFTLVTPGAPASSGAAAPPREPPASFGQIPGGSNGIPGGFTEVTPKGGGALLNPGGDMRFGQDTPDGQTSPEERSVTNFVLNQAPASLIRAAQNIGHSVIHPIDTGNALGNLIAGTFKSAARGVGLEMPENESDQVARASWDYLANRYGGLDNIKTSLYHDPVGVMMDLSTALTGAGGLVRGAGAAAELTGAARAAEVAGTVGRGLGKAGEIANPLYVPSKIASGVVSRLIRKPPAVEPPPVEVETHPPFNPKNATFGGEEAFDPSTGQFHDAPGGYKSPQPAQPPPPPVDPYPAFNPKTASFAEEAFDPSTGTFGETPGGGYKSPQPKPPETTAEAVERLRAQWGVKPPKSSGLEPPAQPVAAAPPPPPEPEPAAPPSKPAPPPKLPKPPPEPPGPPQPAAPLKPPAPAGGTLAKTVRDVLTSSFGAGVLTTEAINLITHHMLGSVGGGLITGAAIKYLPMLLKSEAGQRMLTSIGPGSNAQAVAKVARDLVPALNTLYQSQLQQQSMGQSSVLERAKGGRVNPELARLQRERLQLPGIHGMLEGHK